MYLCSISVEHLRCNLPSLLCILIGVKRVCSASDQCATEVSSLVGCIVFFIYFINVMFHLMILSSTGLVDFRSLDFFMLCTCLGLLFILTMLVQRGVLIGRSLLMSGRVLQVRRSHMIVLPSNVDVVPCSLLSNLITFFYLFVLFY